MRIKGRKSSIGDLSPNINDPFGPDLNSERIVQCQHCGEIYFEKDIKWSERGLWVCKFWPECSGAGLGFDIDFLEGGEVE